MSQTRRDILRKGAIAGAGVWAAPVVASVARAGPAAGSPDCGPFDCGYFETEGCPTGCYRARTVDGACECFSDVTCLTCTESGDCPSGSRCVHAVNCCGSASPICMPLCA